VADADDLHRQPGSDPRRPAGAARQRFGLSYLVVGEDRLPALAEIISGR